MLVADYWSLVTEMVLPNFILAGAPKAGSSSFFELLRQHPDIYASSVKEPFFFDFNFERGIDWYEQFFRDRRHEQAIGEATVWYMRWPSVPERIHRTLPDVKLIFILRNPIERAFSNYMMDLNGGHYTPEQTFGYVIRNEDRVPSLNRTIVSAGYYYQHLQRFEKYFDRSQILVLLYDDFVRDWQVTLRQACEFLNVDPDVEVTLDRDRMVGAYLRHGEFLSDLSRRFPPFRLAWRKSRHFRNLLYENDRDRHNRKRNPIAPEDREYLQNLYRDGNQKLADAIGRDLSHWN